MHAIYMQRSNGFSRFHVQNTLFLNCIDILQKKKRTPEEQLIWMMSMPVTLIHPSHPNLQYSS